MKQWASFLMFDGTTDGILRALSVIIIGIVLVKYSTIFEEEYTKKLTNLYIQPWWRFLIVLLLLSSIMWCPRVGILMMLLVFFYFSDMESLITPFSTL
jgi:hypothetical protein